MKEIIFKAKRIDNGEWVEGFYWTNLVGNHFIKIAQDKTGRLVIEDFEINPDTLCQFTGLFDKNENKIWENDIVLFEKYKAIIKFEKGQYMMKWLNRTYFRKDLYFFATESKDDIQVIGNIFDNTDLLEVE